MPISSKPIFVPIRTTSAKCDHRPSVRGAATLLPVLWLCLTGIPPASARAAQAAPTTQGVQVDYTIERYRKVLATRPSADNHAALAWVLSRYKSDNVEALEQAQSAIQSDPGHYKSHEIAAAILEMQGLDDQVLPHLLAMIDQSRPETPYYIHRISELTLPIERRREAVAALQRFIEQPGRPLDRAAARWVLGELLLREGQADAARKIYDGLGFLRNWRIIGPFDNEANSGFALAYGPEKEIDPNKSYAGRGAQVAWRKLEHFTSSGLVNLAGVMYPNDQVLAYALTYVRVPVRTEAVLRFGVEQAVRLWVNDRLLLADDQDKGFTFDQFAVPVVLQAGWNKVLLKVCRHGGEWRLGLRLTDRDGNPLSGAITTADPQPVPTVATQPAASFEYQGTPLDYFSRRIAEDKQNESAVYYLGLTQAAHHRRTPAMQTFEWLALLNRNCSEYRLRLALAYWADEKPDKAFEELKAALELEPKNLTALVLLGRFYQTRDSMELARQTLEASAAAQPNAAAGHYALAQYFQARGWNWQAYLKARKLHEMCPQTSSLTAYFANLCDAFGYRQKTRELLIEAVKQDHANTAARQSLIDLALREDRPDEALKHYEILQQLLPLSHAVRLGKADLHLRRQAYEPAIAVCREAIAICPQNAEVYTKLGEIFERMERPVEAVTAWRAALRHKPDDHRLRDYVDFLQPKQENPAFAKYGMSPADVAAILKTPADADTYPKAAFVRLLQHRITQVYDDGSTSTQEHVIVKVLNERGRQEYTRVPLQGQQMRVLRAVVVKPDGSEVEATRVSNQEIHFAQLQPGSILEYRVSYQTQGTSWLSRHFSHVESFQTAGPLVRGRLVLLFPPQKPVRHMIRGEHIKLTKGEFQGQDVYDFLAENVPMAEPEVAMPPQADILEQVRLSTIEYWDEIARWEWALMKDQFESDSAIRQKVKEVIAGCRTPRDRMRAIYNFVAQKIQYKVSHIQGIFGVKPPKASNVLTDEWGECKGKAALLIAMLHEAGLSARYATVRTRDAGRLVRDLPANQCNHAIVYVPASEATSGQEAWLDPTAEYHGLGTLPWADRGASAMVWDSEGHMTFIDVPQARPGENMIRLVLEADLTAGGSARVRAHWSAAGEFAAGFRQQFRQVGQRRQQLEALVTNLQAGGRLGEMSFSDLTDRDGPVEVQFDFRAERYAEPTGTTVTLRPKRRFELTARYAPRTERRYDLWLPMPSTVEYGEIYRFDSSWTIKSVPEPVRIETPWIDYEVQYTTQPGMVRTDKRLIIKATDIPKTEYSRLRQFCISADEHEQKTIVLEPRR